MHLDVAREKGRVREEDRRRDIQSLERASGEIISLSLVPHVFGDVEDDLMVHTREIEREGRWLTCSKRL